MMTAVCVFILIYHLTSSCILYFSYETDVNVALVTRRQLTFPAVTICNLNPVKNSAVSESSALSRLINDARRKRKKRDTSAATSRLVNDDTHKGKTRENSVFNGITKHDKKKRYKRKTSASLRTQINISDKGTCLVGVHGECEYIVLYYSMLYYIILYYIILYYIILYYIILYYIILYYIILYYIILYYSIV